MSVLLKDFYSMKWLTLFNQTIASYETALFPGTFVLHELPTFG